MDARVWDRVEATVRRNTLLLAAGMACLSGMLQLVAGVATITFNLVTGLEGLLGAGPALTLVAGALAALPAGRAMDRLGRVKVIIIGFATGAAGCSLVALSAATEQSATAILGLLLTGASIGTVNLSRTAAADMYPPERRARGISMVIFGAVFGAALGPLVFVPIFGTAEPSTNGLVVPWLAAAGFMVAGGLIVSNVRPDPKEIGERLGFDPPGLSSAAGEGEPLRAVLRRPGAIPALAAAVMSFAVMVGVMNLTGHVIVEHGHHQSSIFPVISVHLLGMFGLVLVVGELIERIGRGRALVGGLALIAVSCLALTWIEAVVPTGVALFALGLGWSFSFVAATAALSDLASPAERGRLIGLTDMAAGLTGAALVLAGGLSVVEIGVASLSIGGAALSVAAIAVVVRYRRAVLPGLADT